MTNHCLRIQNVRDCETLQQLQLFLKIGVCSHLMDCLTQHLEITPFSELQLVLKKKALENDLESLYHQAHVELVPLNNASDVMTINDLHARCVMFSDLNFMTLMNSQILYSLCCCAPACIKASHENINLKS